jgi:CheY-like chemotaxis protein
MLSFLHATQPCSRLRVLRYTPELFPSCHFCSVEHIWFGTQQLMPKVLIIDDTFFVADIYRRYLEQQGFSVEIDIDGTDALRRITETKPDAVLLDVMLKNTTGIKILMDIRREREFENLPVIILSSLTSLPLFQQLKQAGATRLFNKTSSKPADVVEAIKMACSAHPASTRNQNPSATDGTSAQSPPG